MITIKDLKKTYQTKPVLKGINLHVEKGDIYGFLGRNGAGKTTTLNILTDLLTYDSGEIQIDDAIKIGYLPESPKFYHYMTGLEYLTFLGELEGHKASPEALLDKVGLTDHKNKQIRRYSRGMQQRLGIAATLFHDPDILLLDEPSSALDPQGRKDILDLILELNKEGKTIFFSTHILSDVEKVCNKVGILHEGLIVIEDDLENIMKTKQHYKVSTPDPEGLADLIQSNSKLKILRLDKKHLELIVLEDIDLFKYLAELPLQINELILIKPTLEDIFVKVVK